MDLWLLIPHLVIHLACVAGIAHIAIKLFRAAGWHWGAPYVIISLSLFLMVFYRLSVHMMALPKWSGGWWGGLVVLPTVISLVLWLGVWRLYRNVKQYLDVPANVQRLIEMRNELARKE